MCPWTAEQKQEQYERRKAALMAEMGGSCAVCHSTDRLEFHHPLGRGYEPKDYGSAKRLEVYRRDFQDGGLELRCFNHHPRKGRPCLKSHGQRETSSGE